MKTEMTKSQLSLFIELNKSFNMDLKNPTRETVNFYQNMRVPEGVEIENIFPLVRFRFENYVREYGGRMARFVVTECDYDWPPESYPGLYTFFMSGHYEDVRSWYRHRWIVFFRKYRWLFKYRLGKIFRFPEETY